MLEHGIMKRTILFTILLTVLSTESYSQPTATDLSYYPLHMGNIWLYRVYRWTPQGEQFSGYRDWRIIGDSVFSNGKRYFVFNDGESLRVDSTTGVVFGYRVPNTRTNCPDTTEYEAMNLSVHADSQYVRCGEHFGLWGWHVTSWPSGIIGELYVNIVRPRRQWLEGFSAIDLRYAEGIGLYYMSGGNSVDIYYLYHARINGVDYWPVDFRSFAAAVLPGNQVHLRWRTENEVQNAGFSVQRQPTDGGALWEDLTFIPANAPEWEGADYEYTDNTASDLPTGSRLAYRLRQLDYDGTESYSDIVEVALSHAPESATLTAWPNPASMRLSMYANSISEGTSQLLVTDLLGRELRRFESVNNAVLTWDLTTTNGARVPPGMYRLLLVGQRASIGRMVVVR